MRYILAVAILLIAGEAYGADHTVATDGSGTFKTIAQVNAHAFIAGDNIYFRRGDTWDEANSLVVSSGNSTSRITYSAYGVGADPIITSSGAKEQSVYGDDEQYVTISNINFTGGVAGKRLIFLSGATDITIQNCSFSGATAAYAIYFYQDSTTRDMTNIVVNSCTFSNPSTTDTIRFGNWNHTYDIHDCEITDCTFSNITGNAIRFYSPDKTYVTTKPNNIDILRNTITTTTACAIIVDTGSYFLIKGNTASDIGSAAVANINAFQLNDFDNSIIEFNSISDVDTSVADGIGIILDYGYTDTTLTSDNTVVRYNIISDCTADVACSGINNYYATNSLIYGNIIYNCPRGISGVNAESTGGKFYNNTIDDVTVGIYLRSNFPTAEIYNNIIENATSYGIVYDSGASAPTEDYNDFYNITTANKWNGGASVAISAHSITTNPTLDSNYRLLKSSPCIDSGITLSTVTDDYEGNPRPMGHSTDIGAYEYFSSKIIGATI